MPMPDRLDTEEDQVRGAGQLDHREHRDGPLDDRPDPEGNGHHLDVHTERVADDGGERTPAPEHEGSTDYEQYAGPGYRDQRERRERKREQMVVRDHFVMLGRVGRPPLPDIGPAAYWPDGGTSPQRAGTFRCAAKRTRAMMGTCPIAIR